MENKRTEFDHALFGSVGLESCLGALLKVTDLETAIGSLTRLKSTFGIVCSSISEGEPANLSLFNPNIEWVFTEESILSASKNAALKNQIMKGNVYGIINNNQLIINE